MRTQLAGSTILVLIFMGAGSAARGFDGTAGGSAAEQARFERVRAASTLPAVQQAGGEDARDAQKRTVRDIRNVGTAMFSWLTDQVGASASAAAVETKDVDLKDYPAITHGELEKILVPQYLQAIPEKDGWGNPYEFYLNTAKPLDPKVMAIRSLGRDGRASAGLYRVSAFEPESYDEDIVWVDGFFVRWPQAQAKTQAR